MVECGGLENRFARNPGNEGSNPSSSARANLQARQCAGPVFTSRVRGFEPVRWFAVKKTCQWHVFRQTPDRACEGGVRVRAAKARIPPPPPERPFRPGSAPGLFFVLCLILPKKPVVSQGCKDAGRVFAYTVRNKILRSCRMLHLFGVKRTASVRRPERKTL